MNSNTLMPLTKYVSVFLILCCVGIASGEEVIDSICAIVDDEIILESEVTYGVNSLLLENKIRFPTSAQITDLRQQVLDAFIIQKVLLARAAEETLQVEDRIVERELERKLQALITQVGGEDKLVDYFGKPLRLIKREMRKGVREGLLIEMLKQQHLAGMRIRRQEVLDFYNEHKDEMPELPESVSLSHIMLEVKVSEESEQIARDKTNGIRKLLIDGADFDSLARERSEDPSAENGGRLGFTNRGDLVPEYEEVAYNLEPMEISEIVESRYGLHIVRLLERQGERISTQHILVVLAPTPDDLERVKNKAEDLRNRIIGDDSFTEMAEKYSDDLESAASGGRLDPLALADLPLELREVVDALDVGEISAPVVTTYGVHIIRLENFIPARKISLSRDWQSIELYATNYKRDKVFTEWVENLKKDHYIWLQ